MKLQKLTALLFLFLVLISFSAFSKKKKKNTKLESAFRMNESSNPITSIDFSEDNLLLATIDIEGGINIFEFEKEQLQTDLKSKRLGEKKPISISFSDKNNRAVLIGTVGNINYEFDVFNTKLLKEAKGVPKNSCFYNVSKDGKFLFTAVKSQTGSFQMMNVSINEPVRTYSGHKAKVRLITLSRDNSLLASCDESNTIFFWDPTENKRKDLVNAHGRISCMRFSEDAKYLFVTSLDGRVLVYDTETRKLVNTIKGSGIPLYSLAVSRNDAFVAVGTKEGEIIIYDARKIRGEKEVIEEESSEQKEKIE